jgi:energy-coupling factor transporter ATP-binding protein EcfA2
MKALAKLKKMDIADPLARVRISIPGVEAKKGIAFSCNKLEIGYDKKVIASGSTFDIDRGAKVAIVGANGQGKTTFLKTLVGELPSLGGTFRWGHGTSSVYYAQHVASRLPNNELVWDYLRKHADSTLADETILQMAGNFLFREAALEKKIGALLSVQGTQLVQVRRESSAHHDVFPHCPFRVLACGGLRQNTNTQSQVARLGTIAGGLAIFSYIKKRPLGLL